MNAERILLILDLDECLVHATEQRLPREHDFVVGPYYVYRRPGLQDLLYGCAQAFDLAFWSSGTTDYVEAIINEITPEGVEPRFIWARPRCIRRFDYDRCEETFLKDLRKVKRLGYSLGRVLIVDDEPVKLSRNYGNAIYVRPFTGQPEDDELNRLLPYLLSIQHVADVRGVEKRGWRSTSVDR
jgi:TFIIF-interacting CTD phosphatase-like protein